MSNNQVCSICLAYMTKQNAAIGWLRCICGNRKMEKEIITLKDFFMGRDESHKDELTKEFQENAQILVTRVNAFLTELGITTAKVSSGWRPPSINAATPGAGKTSAHLSCQAVDILDDKEQSLAKKVLENLDLVEKYDLYIENPDRTKGKNQNWLHVQIRKASKRVFQP
jgi:hypothetical protein